MYNIRVNAEMFKASMVVAKHGKANLRYVLSGVNLKKDGSLYATNGHILFQGHDCILDGYGNLENDIIIPYIKIAKDVHTITIFINDVDIRIDMQGKKTDTSINTKLLEGNYPNIEQFMYIEKSCQIVESKSFAVSPKYIKMACDIFPEATGLRIEKFIRNEGSQIAFIVSNMVEEVENWKFLIMPINDLKYDTDPDDIDDDNDPDNDDDIDIDTDYD